MNKKYLYETGALNIRSLHDLAKKEPNAPSVNGNTSSSRKFTECVKELVKDIPYSQGVYLWGNLSVKNPWVNIYIGKADNRKNATLAIRISDELKEEKLFLWRPYYSSDEEAVNNALKIYKTPGPKSRSHYARSLRKKGTTNIIWIALPEELIPSKIEDCLIELMNPTANVQRKEPDETYIQKARIVMSQFEQHINELTLNNTHNKKITLTT